MTQLEQGLPVSFARGLERRAFEEFKQQFERHVRGLRRNPKTFRYYVPQWHADAVDAMGRNDEGAAKWAVLEHIAGRC